MLSIHLLRLPRRALPRQDKTSFLYQCRPIQKLIITGENVASLGLKFVFIGPIPPGGRISRNKDDVPIPVINSEDELL
jgi:hypothetical protein